MPIRHRDRRLRHAAIRIRRRGSMSRRHRDAVVDGRPGEANADIAIRLIAAGFPMASPPRYVWRGAAYQLKAPLFGEHQGRNIALAFAAACASASCRRMSSPACAARRRSPIVSRSSARMTARSSSTTPTTPTRSALPRRWVARCAAAAGRAPHPGHPGMVELGAAHQEEHERIGRLAAEHVDVLLAVAPQRVEPLARGLRGGRAGARDRVLRRLRRSAAMARPQPRRS